MNILKDTLYEMFYNPTYCEDYYFYAAILSKCNIDKNSSHIAAVSFSNGSFTLHINEELFAAAKLEHRIGILKHEALHIIFEHLTRFIEEIKERQLLVNLATDCAINQHIKKQHIPTNTITLKYIEKLCNKRLKKLATANYYYDELLVAFPSKEKEDQIDQDIDNHDWGDSPSEIDKKQIENETTNIVEDSKSETFDKFNKLPGAIESSRFAKNIVIESDKTNWSNILQNLLTVINGKKLTSKRRSRRFPNRTEIKGKVNNKTTNVLIIADISGSMSNKKLTDSLNKIHSITKTVSECNLIQVDSIAREPEILSNNSKTFTRKGFGATLLSRGLDKAVECKLKFDVIIVMTDGEISQSDRDEFIGFSTIWLISCSKSKENFMRQYFNKSKFKTLFL